MTEKSYKERMERAKTQTHLKLVVSKPTSESDIEAVPEQPQAKARSVKKDRSS